MPPEAREQWLFMGEARGIADLVTVPTEYTQCSLLKWQNFPNPLKRYTVQAENNFPRKLLLTDLKELILSLVYP